MMTIQQMTQHITARQHFKTLREYEDFAMAFLDFVEGDIIQFYEIELKKASL